MAENILQQGFCPLKIKITQFPNFNRNRFCLKIIIFLLALQATSLA